MMCEYNGVIAARKLATCQLDPKQADVYLVTSISHLLATNPSYSVLLARGKGPSKPVTSSTVYFQELAI